MRFPSIVLIRDRAVGALRRFPGVILASGLATITAFQLIQSSGDATRERLLLTGIVAFALLIAGHLLGERLGRLGRILMPLGAVAVGAIFFFTSRSLTDGQLGYRALQWGLVFHLAVAVVWFVGLPERNGYWQFNRVLFERLLLASVFAGVLAVGLSVALLAIDNLLGIDVPGKTYPRLFALIGFVVHPWFFLAGIPDDREQLERSQAYPVVLKVFAQYILIPLVTVYLLILTAYLGRVMVTRVWPSGWIGYLVSSVAVTGTLALLLVHPLREREEGRWVNAYARWFFVALVPSLVMLLMAVGKRIGQYGVTEPRYALAVLGGWLLLLSVFFAVTRSKSIRVIPTSLALVAGVAALGPWGMAATARRSQVDRFAGIMARGQLGTDSVGRGNQTELRAIGYYLRRWHGPDGLALVADVPADSLRKWQTSIAVDLVDTVLARRGIGWRVPAPGRFMSVVFTSDPSKPSEGIDLGNGAFYYGARYLFGSFSLQYRGDTLAFVPDRAAGRLTVSTGTDSTSLAIGAAVEAISGDQFEAIRMAKPLSIEARLGDGTRIQILLTDAAWMPGDSTSRSATGAIVISGPPKT